MASTTFVLKEPNSSEPTLIYMLFRFNNNVLKYSTGQKIHPKFWNSENHRVRETKQFKQYSEFNTFLKNLDDDIHNIYRKLINDNIIPTPDRLRSELKNTSVESQIVKKNDLIGFINDYIKSSVKRPNTLRNYRQTLRVLNDFKPHFKKSLVFENIDREFERCKFLSYLPANHVYITLLQNT